MAAQGGFVNKTETARDVRTSCIGHLTLNAYWLRCERMECKPAQKHDGLRYIAVALGRNTNPVANSHRRYASVWVVQPDASQIPIRRTIPHPRGYVFLCQPSRQGLAHIVLTFLHGSS